MDNPLKRKFSPPPPPSGAGIGIHPDRLAAIEATPASSDVVLKAKKPKVAKEKTEAQKRYAKKERLKRRKVVAARQPKVSKFDAIPLPEPTLTEGAGKGAEGMTELEMRGARKAEKRAKREARRREPAAAPPAEVEVEGVVQLEVEVEAEAGPSTPRAPSPTPAVVEVVEEIIVEAPVEGKKPKDKKDKKQKKAKSDPSSTSLIPTSARPLPTPSSPPPTLDPSLSLARTPSPPPPSNRLELPPNTLPLFPLPSRPAPASAAELALLGLPEGLRRAVVVPESLRIEVEGLVVEEGGGGPWRRGKGDGGQEGQGGLGKEMVRKLKEMGVEEFFAVQAALLPPLLALPLTPFPGEKLNDYLVSAPTGSGKTLAYGVPIIEVLKTRVVTRLRALIVLPTRDLVGQVREVLESLAKGTGLKIGTATGQHSFASEQGSLVGPVPSTLLGGQSKVDILIATPGRLMEHLQGTAGFSLQHLRFLVIDEADRLLTQSFQDWLNQILLHLRPPPISPPLSPASGGRQMEKGDQVAGRWVNGLGVRGGGEWEGYLEMEHTCQKLLFSATLTRDPSKIAALKLRNPKYFIVKEEEGEGGMEMMGREFAVPAGLTEKMLILPPALKPLNLLHLLHSPQFGITSALCFTKSVDSANRLLKLLEAFEEAYEGVGKRLVVRGYSGELGAGVRGRLLAEFKKGEIDVLICSDLIARGIDLPTVSHVISYDIPLDMRKYVHRVGRTARAGREGTAWSLVEKQEGRHFKEMLDTAGHKGRVKKVKVQEEDLGYLREGYEVAMKKLKIAFEKN